MYRVLFFILFVTLFFYGVSGILSPFKNISQTQISQDFENYLSGALARNASEKKLYDVVWKTEDFTGKTPRGSYFLRKNNTVLPEKTFQNSQGYIVRVGSEQIASPKGNYGTPSLESQVGQESSNCAGLIFDPCLVLTITTHSNSTMDFGVWRSL